MLKQSAKGLIIVLVLLAACEHAGAGPIYSIRVGGSGPTGMGRWIPPGLSTYTDPGHSVIGTHHYKDFFNDVDREWFAQVNQGSLHAGANIGVLGRQPHLWDTVVDVGFVYDDIILSSTESSDDITLDFDLSGVISANKLHAEWAGAGATVTLTARLDGINRIFSQHVSATNANPSSILAIDQLVSLTFPNVQMNQNVTLSVELHAAAAGGNAAADFSNSLNFVTGGPVFTGANLLNVNSVQAGIFNNRYSLPETNAVPEPSSMALLGMGCCGIFAVGWRRRLRGRTA